MTVEHYKQYATEAFRLYAREGKPTYEQMRNQIYNEILASSKRELIHIKGINDPTASAVINAEEALIAQKGKLLDILAVGEVMSYLSHDEAKAIELVYFTDANERLQRGEIKLRVLGASLDIPADPSTIYRWLKAARLEFARQRGLRI